MYTFKLKSSFKPQGDQPKAIETLVKNLNAGVKDQVLLGVTGSGKTFTMACVIEKLGRPALIIAHNKTLAAQIYGELKDLFPENRVEYFVSYYDYYQPEAYIPHTDTYIEKDSAINEDIERLRHSATRSLYERNDTVVIASVSCIYGLGSPDYYEKLAIKIIANNEVDQKELLRHFVDIQYERNDIDFTQGTFRLRGNVLDVWAPYEEKNAYRIEFEFDTIKKISEIDTLTGDVVASKDEVTIFPASHYSTPKEELRRAINLIRQELQERISYFKTRNLPLEAERIEQRTLFDLEMIEEIGFCKGIENYSRYLTGRRAGEPPPCLLDYFPKDYIMFIDESHVTVPQVRGMYEGDRSRKDTLVKYGFRLPSAMDNRPLSFQEFLQLQNQTIFVSATPGNYEIEKSQSSIAEQIIRPTGLIDPKVEVRSLQGQIDDLYFELKNLVEKKQRALVTALTKKQSEKLAEYLEEMGLKVKYLHSDIDIIERTKIIKDLRLGVFDVLVGVNLLREGLDIPEVSLVAILDADKEGFLRSKTSLIQTSGRAARHVEGRVIMYADTMTHSIQSAIAEMERRQKIQQEYNIKNNITPESVKKSLSTILDSIYERDYLTVHVEAKNKKSFESETIRDKYLAKLEKDMKKAAKTLNFELATKLRDEIKRIKADVLF